MACIAIVVPMIVSLIRHAAFTEERKRARLTHRRYIHIRRARKSKRFGRSIRFQGYSNAALFLVSIMSRSVEKGDAYTPTTILRACHHH